MIKELINVLKAFIYTTFYLFKCTGIKGIDGFKKRFGTPDISMPGNAKEVEWTITIQKVCSEKNLNFKSLTLKFTPEEDSKPQKLLMTHMWFLSSNIHIMFIEEYDVGKPKITLGNCESCKN